MQRRWRERLDWSALGKLRLRAKRVADGTWTGSHASRKRGAGLEFAGHRSYVPGDDLRWLDQRALLRHGRPLVKQFETETDRTLRLVVDASESMGFRSQSANASKFEQAALLAAALTRVSVRTGDAVGLDFLSGQGSQGLRPSGGTRAFERITLQLAQTRVGGHVAAGRDGLEAALAAPLHGARRGNVVVVLSDLLDFGDDAPEVLGALGTGGRQAAVVQVLDPLEATFDLEGPVRLQSSELGLEVETNASAARQPYLERMRELQSNFRRALEAQGGALISCRSDSDPVGVLRSLLQAMARGPR